MEVLGKIKMVCDTKVIGASSFRTRDLIITTDEQYPQHISVQFVQDKCDLLDSFRLGESVTVGINLRGREWISPQGETKYFNTIQGWKVSRQNVEQHTPQPQSAVDAYENKSNTADSNSGDYSNDPDDLPF